MNNANSNRKLDRSSVMNLTGFSTQLSDRLILFMYFRHFSSQSHVLSFSECLNVMPGVLVVGSERGDDKNKKIKGDLCKLRNLSCHLVQISTEFDIIHFRSGLLKRRMKSIFHA